MKRDDAGEWLDLTGEVRLDDPAAVAEAVISLLGRRHPATAEHAALLKGAFVELAAAYWGRRPGYLACDTPYHDLRHAFDTALLTARLVDGHAAARAGGESALSAAPSAASSAAAAAALPVALSAALSADEAVLTVLLALLHDAGYLRRADEGARRGATLAAVHERRGVDFAREFLAATPLAPLADAAELIEFTRFSCGEAELAARHPARRMVMARIIASADLVSQVSDRYYLERCRDFLFREFSEAAAGDLHPPTPFGDADQLLAGTPGFVETMVLTRLDGPCANVRSVLVAHFAGEDPFAAAMTRNLDYLRRLLAENRLHQGLRRQPAALLAPEGLR